MLDKLWRGFILFLFGSNQCCTDYTCDSGFIFNGNKLTQTLWSIFLHFASKTDGDSASADLKIKWLRSKTCNGDPPSLWWRMQTWAKTWTFDVSEGEKSWAVERKVELNERADYREWKMERWRAVDRGGLIENLSSVKWRDKKRTLLPSLRSTEEMRANSTGTS